MEGITNAGKTTEELFCDITGAISRKNSETELDKDDKKRGDVWLDGYRVEIKKAKKQSIRQDHFNMYLLFYQQKIINGM